jgi:Domain of unknown function (DUF5060)
MHTNRKLRVPVLATAIVMAAALVLRAANFTSASETASMFGVHEIVMTGNGAVSNPFDVVAVVRFLPPSGEKDARLINAFYDGSNAWRARVYVSEAGAWKWSSRCESDSALDGKSGQFVAAASKLHGRLLVHPRNPRQWITEDGRWFLNLNDTAYFLLCRFDANGQPIPEQDARDYVRDVEERGVTSLRCFLASSERGFREAREQWRNWIFADDASSQLRLDNLQCADGRLRSLLDSQPDLAVQLIILPLAAYGRDEDFWKNLSAVQKERVLRYLVARYAAYPQLFWLIANDVHYGDKFPANNAMAREVGKYFEQHDPWQHPRSTGPARRLKFPFADESWATYIHIEDLHDLGAQQYLPYERHEKPVFLGEDRYENDHGPKTDPAQMDYWQRRLYWSWLLSGGSANYGGRWWVMQPYSTTGKREAQSRWSKDLAFRDQLTGLDSVKHIRSWFAVRKIELSDFEPAPALVKDADGDAGIRSPKLMRREQREFIIYHPNGAEDGREAHPHATRAPGAIVDLSNATGRFTVEWYRVRNGEARAGGTMKGGKPQTLRSPWTGEDCVVRLRLDSVQ